MDAAVTAYLDAVPAGRRALFDRLHALIVDSVPDVAVGLAYAMPTYTLGRRRLHLGVWKHGVSVYGWTGRDGGFVERHPALRTSVGTIRLRDEDAAALTDADLIEFFRRALLG